MQSILVNGFRLNLEYTFKLVEDIREEEMTTQPNGIANHPAFTLGHLITATAISTKAIGGPYDVPEEWDALFKRRGPGDPRMPESDTGQYPSKEELIKELKRQADRLIGLIEGLKDEAFQADYPWKLHSYLPSLGGYLYFLCHIHHGWHIGQLAEWRRQMGYESALKKL